MEILAERTKELFGYYPSELSCGSGRKVVLLCSVCGKEKTSAYKDLVKGNGFTHNSCKSLLSKKTFLKKYHVDNPAKLESIKQKARETNRKKYGADYHTQTQAGKERLIQGKLRKNYDKYIARLDDVTPLFTVSEFNGIRNKLYPFKCNKCNHIFHDHFNDLKVPRCHKCFPRYSYSKQQKDLYKFVESFYNGEIIENYRIERNEFDIYLPEINFAIEYHGLYYHSEIAGGKQSHYHLNKYQIAKKNNITLLQIFEDEWLNKREVVERVIKHKIGYTDKKVYARKCTVRVIDSAKEFLDKYHLQGNASSSIKLGLYHKDELVAIMTFSKMRKCLGSVSKQDDYELVRFASKYSVIGGASKLFSYFVKEYHPNKVTTYADLRWSNGDLYHKLGFKFIHISKPNYWYVNFNLGAYRYHRFNFRKSVLESKLDKFDQNLTEFENMVNNGWDRVWDCGNMKFIWEK